MIIAALLGLVQSMDPSKVEELTVYHVNQATFGVAPVNMDTGLFPIVVVCPNLTDILSQAMPAAICTSV
jgi:hypothetical protein